MREAISFFTPVSYGDYSQSKIGKLLEFVDDCFFFGGHKAVLLSPALEQDSQRVKIQSFPAAKTALKIIAWMACFIATLWNPLAWSIPATLLGLKILLRSTRSFHLQTDVLEVPCKVKIPSVGNFRALRNQEAGSDLSIIPYQGNRESKIHAHSHLLTDYFQNLGSKVMRQGLDEKEENQTFDLSQCPSATPKNIHLYLDYQYGLGIEQTVSVEQLISLFEFADFIGAVKLKKKILHVFLHLPESREDVRLAPLLRKMFLSDQLDNEEFEYFYTWLRECSSTEMADAIEKEEVQKLAENGNTRAKFLLIRAKNLQKSFKLASELAKDLNNPLCPLGQYMLHMDYRETDPKKALELLEISAKAGCASAIGTLSLLYFEGELGNIKLHKNEQLALELAEEATEKDNLYGIYVIGKMCFQSVSGKFLHSRKAFAYMQKAARIGYRWGEFYLAYLFEHGIGVKTNPEKAIELYRKALHSFHLKNNDHSMDDIIANAIRRLQGRTII